MTIVCVGIPLKAYSQGVTMTTFGVGNSSCATWLSTPIKEYEGKAWIYGAWSGMNFKNQSNHVVGDSTDAEGIVGEVKAMCFKEPSLPLRSATYQTYVRLERANR